MASHARILIVDDQPLNRLLLGTVLRSLNLDVIEAGDGRAGLEAYLEHGTALSMIFMDIMMPVCNGIQAVLSIRSAESQQGWLPVPIVAFTSEDVRQGSLLWNECQRAGFNDVVAKPVSKRFATQLLCRCIPGLGERWSSLTGAASTHSVRSGAGAAASEVLASVCSCGGRSSAAAACVKCSTAIAVAAVAIGAGSCQAQQAPGRALSRVVSLTELGVA